MESIIGHNILPKGSGTVTRCPIEIRLLKSTDERAYVWSQYDRRDNFVKENFRVPIRGNIASGHGTISLFFSFLKIYDKRYLSLKNHEQ